MVHISTEEKGSNNESYFQIPISAPPFSQLISKILAIWQRQYVSNIS